MGTVCENNKCAGCKACIDICPKNAITISDTIETLNAFIDENRCIECGLCHKVCPNNTLVPLQKPLLWVQGWANDQEERVKSSSGGFATEIAKAFVKQGGKVCSCVFCDGEFRFQIEDTVEGIEKFRGSKYIKSDPKGIYKIIKAELISDNKILFIGLPCQVAALKNYVGSKLETYLYTIDLICHGTPSNQLLEMYLEQNFKINIRDLKQIGFREKTKFSLTENKQRLVPQRVQDKYTMGFLEGFIYTENCYSCRYATVDRVSDLTLGDSWNSQLSASEQQKGISLGLCQSNKGKWLIEIADIQSFEVDIEKAIKGNRQLQRPTPISDQRSAFMKSIKKHRKYSWAVLAANPEKSMKQDIKTALCKLRILGGGVNDNNTYIITYEEW